MELGASSEEVGAERPHPRLDGTFHTTQLRVTRTLPVAPGPSDCGLMDCLMNCWKLSGQVSGNPHMMIMALSAFGPGMAGPVWKSGIARFRRRRVHALGHLRLKAMPRYAKDGDIQVSLRMFKRMYSHATQ